MKSLAAAEFKNNCLRTLDEVARTKSGVVITKRGRPIAKLVPYVARERSLVGSVVKESAVPTEPATRGMPTLIDTHAWLWWVTEDRRLSKRAAAAIRKAQAVDDLWLSAISLWELGKKVEKGQLHLDRPLEDWLDAAVGVDGLNVRDLSRPVLLESCRLPQPFHGDPADQMIVATARHDGAVLVTRDERIRGYGHVRTIW